jgi:tetratricopeptide (TPR) repeat protein
LTDDLVDWFDAGIWEQFGTGEFCQPVAPEQLLAEAPEFIWPVLMPPDLLPLLGNRSGDWLCLRFGATAASNEIVHWYHGGGDWIPWGRTLAEAVAFDRLRPSLPGPRQVYAEAAETLAPLPSARPLHRWAADHLPADVAATLTAPAPATTPALIETMLAEGICEIALRCELALASLDNLLRRQLTSQLAHELEIPWQSQAVRWMFDPQLIPPEARLRLAERLGLAEETLLEQDWETATQHAEAVARQRSDLGWPLDLCGWAAERTGQFERAIPFYERALGSSSFTDQTIRFRSHWCVEAKGKFAAARLRALASDGSDPTGPRTGWAMTYLQRLSLEGAEARAQAVTQFWVDQADQASEAGDPALAYERLYMAGWDLGARAMDEYRSLLQRMAEFAAAADQPGRAAVARTHLACLESRFSL